MRSLAKKASIILAIFALIAGGIFAYYKKTYPYGYTHRCSKAFAMELMMWAEEHDGNYPNFVSEDKLLIKDYVGDSDYNLEMIIGKTIDFDEAKAFYTKHGYILDRHSAWHFVNDVKSSHEGRAFAWDKIPLGHNGQVEDSKSREVIEVSFMMSNIPESEWDKYLEKQTITDWENLYRGNKQK